MHYFDVSQLLSHKKLGQKRWYTGIQGELGWHRSGSHMLLSHVIEGVERHRHREDTRPRNKRLIRSYLRAVELVEIGLTSGQVCDSVDGTGIIR